MVACSNRPSPPLYAKPALLLTAHVAEVREESPGFRASVWIAPRSACMVPVVRLNELLRGMACEGAVMRWAMECLVAGEPDYYEYGTTPEGETDR